jgi:predicted NBD/HSP70 family sugar kinase
MIDTNFKPLSIAFREAAKNGELRNVGFSIERHNGYTETFRFGRITYTVFERAVKSAIWAVGGYKVFIGASEDVFAKLARAYSIDGARSFDVLFMQKVYQKAFEIKRVPLAELPEQRKETVAIGGFLNGNRIGFDAGGSDRKVSAVVNGKVVYSEETVWNPKLESNPDYHYNGICDSFKRAASKMKSVDAVGVSSAGIYIANRTAAASLFIKVSDTDFDRYCRDIYIRAARDCFGGNVKLAVANDGDVTALAGATEFHCNNILGIAMGTSEAAGYIGGDGRINGFLSELAFVPVDADADACRDEWSGDIGCGVKYFSQDGVIKLAERAGITFDSTLTPAQKLKVVQQRLADGDKTAIEIFRNIGEYLGYAIPWYSLFYKIDNLMLLGRVLSGAASELITENAKRVLTASFPEYGHINFLFPSEEGKRVGQSIAAASLAE